MLIATLILMVLAFGIGALSSAREKTFLLLVFIGLPAYGFATKYISAVNFPLRPPNGDDNIDRIKDLFLQIPEEYRLGVILFAPVFIFGRAFTWGFISSRKEKLLTPEQIQAKRQKILKSYTGRT